MSLSARLWASTRRRAAWFVSARSGSAAVLQTTVLRVLTLVANLATGVVTARALAPFGRGELAAINLLPQLLGSLLTLGLPSALLYHLRRDRERAREHAGAALLLSGALGIAGIAVGALVLPRAMHDYPSHAIVTARWFLFTVPLNLLLYSCVSFFESDGDFWYANQARFLTPLVTLVTLLAFAATHRLTVTMAALAYALPLVPISAKMLVDVVRRVRPRLTAAADVYRNLLGYGVKSYGLTLLNALAQQIDQALVIGFLSPAAMGLYAVALSISRAMQVFQGSIVAVLLPRMAAQSIDTVVEKTGFAVRVSAALSLPVACVVFAFGPAILKVFYGARFDGAVPVLRMLIVEAWIGGSVWILGQAFLAVGRPGTVTVMQALGLSVSVPLMLLLIPRHGLIAAAFALLVSTVVRFVLMMGAFPALLKVRLPNLFVNVDDFRRVLASVRERRGGGPPVSESA